MWRAKENDYTSYSVQQVVFHIERNAFLGTALPEMELPLTPPATERRGARGSKHRLCISKRWTVRGSNPGGDEIFRSSPDRP